MATHTQVAPVEGETWRMVQCARVAAPPLRFVGRCLAWSESAREGSPIHLGLFERKSGGLTISTSRLGEDGWRDHALTVTSVVDAIVSVEQYCADLQDEVDRAWLLESDSPEGWADLCREVAIVAQEVDRYRRLAGRALDQWSLISRADIPENYLEMSEPCPS